MDQIIWVSEDESGHICGLLKVTGVHPPDPSLITKGLRAAAFIRLAQEGSKPSAAPLTAQEASDLINEYRLACSHFDESNSVEECASRMPRIQAAEKKIISLLCRAPSPGERGEA